MPVMQGRTFCGRHVGAHVGRSRLLPVLATWECCVSLCENSGKRRLTIFESASRPFFSHGTLSCDVSINILLAFLLCSPRPLLPPSRQAQWGLVSTLPSFPPTIRGYPIFKKLRGTSQIRGPASRFSCSSIFPSSLSY
jgi:hypothetical protein